MKLWPSKFRSGKLVGVVSKTFQEGAQKEGLPKPVTSFTGFGNLRDISELSGLGKQGWKAWIIDSDMDTMGSAEFRNKDGRLIQSVSGADVHGREITTYIYPNDSEVIVETVVYHGSYDVEPNKSLPDFFGKEPWKMISYWTKPAIVEEMKKGIRKAEFLEDPNTICSEKNLQDKSLYEKVEFFLITPQDLLCTKIPKDYKGIVTRYYQKETSGNNGSGNLAKDLLEPMSRINKDDVTRQEKDGVTEVYISGLVRFPKSNRFPKSKE